MYRQKGVNKRIKSIVKLSDMDLIHFKRNRNPHAFVLTNGVQKDTNGKSFDGPFNFGGPTDIAVLHHYFSKSTKEFHFKGCTTGRADTVKRSKCNSVPPVGDIYDDTAWLVLKKYDPKYSIFDY